MRGSLTTRLSRLGLILSGLLILIAVIGSAVAVAEAKAEAARAQARPPRSHVAARMEPSARRPGVSTSAPSPQALSQALERATGLAPSQVVAQGLCPPPSPGRATCLARALVLRSNHRLVHPLVSGTPAAQVPSGARDGTPAAQAPSADGGTPATLPAPPSTGLAPPLPGTPAYLQQAYDLTALSQSAGSGDTVAIVDAYDDPTAERDLAYYRATFGLPTCSSVSPPGNPCFQKLNERGGASPPSGRDAAWESEISLDLDAVSAICPNCRIVLVEADTSHYWDLIQAESTAASIPGVKQISNSWGALSNEPFASSFTHAGVSVVASTGDEGYQDQAGMANYPAALPGVTAAGGTTLAEGSDQAGGRGFSESAWSLSGGVGAGSGCNTQVAKPSYQHDTGCNGRSYADASADADPETGISTYDNGRWFTFGGTSLASPVIAAYYALISGRTPALDTTNPGWAYASGSLLNDPITGSVGTCPPSYLYICSAGVGYDGPTGIGSISGAIVQGAPGIGGPSVMWASGSAYVESVGIDSVTLVGGVYPNGLDTTYHWEYGASTSYGQQTRALDVGAGQAPAAMTTTIGGLIPGATYHYRLVASNSAGTVAGYDYSVKVIPASAPQLPSGSTTATTAPVAQTNPVTAFAPGSLAPPSVSGTAREGQTLSATPGAWSGTPTSIRYQWQSCALPGYRCSGIAGATGHTDRLTGADVGRSLAVIVTASNSGGSATATSAYTASIAPAKASTSATRAPQISALRLSPRSFSAKRGTSLAISLSTAASLHLVVRRRVAGRKVGGRCRPGAGTGIACTAAVAVRSLAFRGAAGRNRFAVRLPGLARGRYSATVSARNASAGASKPLTTTFTITR